MEIKKVITADTHQLLVSGRVDGEGANQLEIEILATMRAGAQAIYVNLSEATFLCSAALRVLLQYWRQMKDAQRVLQATRPSPEVAAVLATTGFKDLIVEKMWSSRPELGSRQRCLELILKNEPEEKRRLQAALQEFAREHHFPAKVLQAVDLALEEHLTNVLTHGYGEATPHEVRIRLTVDGGWVQAEVEDDGRPFNPLAAPRVDTSLPLAEKPVGGLGIHILRQFMDELDYQRVGGKNLLRMRKRLA